MLPRCASWFAGRVTQLEDHSCDATKCQSAVETYGWAYETTYEAFHGCKDFQFMYMRPAACSYHAIDAKCVFEAFDFVGLVERFDASMALLALKLDVAFASVLYLPSKVRSTKRAPDPPDRDSRAMIDEVNRLVNSTAFRERNALDLDLWETARRAVEKETSKHQFYVDTYGAMLDSATAFCATYKAADMTCYWGDNGCGVECLDDFVDSESGTSSWPAGARPGASPDAARPEGGNSSHPGPSDPPR